VLEERQRLARELHDSVSQALYSIVLGIKTAQAVLDDDPGRAVDPIEFALLQAEAGLAEMRALIFELRPEALETEGLAAALEKQASFIRDRHRLNVNTRLESEPDVPVSVKEALYRVAQEALHNTVKHAHARTVDIRLDANQSGIELEVRDDGKGFEPNGPFPGHLGLQTMRERVALLGGKLDIQSAPGRGTLIRADVPVAQVAP
jgi:signal transduction histidine kinase